MKKRHYYGYDPETGMHKFDCRDCRDSWAQYKPKREAVLRKDLPNGGTDYAGFVEYHYCGEPLWKKDWLT